MWVLRGEDSNAVADMIVHMAHFLATDGFDAFIAWNERVHSAELNSDAVRTNLEIVRDGFTRTP